jgi:hypothetical protein
VAHVRPLAFSPINDVGSNVLALFEVVFMETARYIIVRLDGR